MTNEDDSEQFANVISIPPHAVSNDGTEQTISEQKDNGAQQSNAKIAAAAEQCTLRNEPITTYTISGSYSFLKIIKKKVCETQSKSMCHYVLSVINKQANRSVVCVAVVDENEGDKHISLRGGREKGNRKI